jgi:O-antigen/teichoic acid export membrane protein
LQGFVLTPLYLVHIGPTLYGAWLALANILSWASMIDPGVARITSQRVALSWGKNQRAQAFQDFYDGMLVALLLGFVPLILVFFSTYPSHFFSLAGPEQEQLTSACRWSLLNIFLVLIDGPVWALVRGLQRPFFLGWAQVFSAVVGILTAAFLLLYADFGIASLPMGAVARVLVELLLKLIFLFSMPEGLRSARPSFPTAAEVWKIFRSYQSGFALVVGTLLRTQLTYFCAAKFVSPYQAAVLAVSAQALLPLQQLIDRTIAAPMAAFSHLVGESGYDGISRVFERMRSACLFLIFVGIAGTVALNFAFVSNWVGGGLFGGTILTCLLALEAGTAMTMLVHQELLFAMGAIGEIGRVRLIEGICKVVAQVGLCLCIGIAGIPLAGILSAFFSRVVLIPRLEARYLGCKAKRARISALWELGRILIATFVGLLGFAVARQTSAAVGWWPFAFGTASAALIYIGVALGVFPSVRREVFGVFAARDSA